MRIRVIQIPGFRESTRQQSPKNISVVSVMGNLVTELVVCDPNSVLRMKHEKSVSLHILEMVLIQGYIIKILTVLLFFLGKNKKNSILYSINSLYHAPPFYPSIQNSEIYPIWIR